MRILFLDFDGVLNSVDWAERRPSKEEFAREMGVSPERYDHDRLTWALRSVDPDAVAALNEIVNRTRARVVISSTWRTMYPLTKLEWILRRRGLEHHLIGTTPCGWDMLERGGMLPRPEGERRVTRGDEIRAWIRTLDAPVHNDDIVIVDDDSDMGELMPRLFQTDAAFGLREHHVDQVVAMFGADRSMLGALTP
jgi:hypothetical protein